MDRQRIDLAVASLRRVRSEGRPLDGFPASAEPATLDEAYSIQDAFVARLGGERSGWKIGCTSKMAQKMSSTDEPFYGRMFARDTHRSPARVDAGAFFHPIVEPEIAFRLGRDLGPGGGPFTEAAVLDAVAAMYPAIEVVDCRYAGGWPIGIRPTVADNGVHGCFVCGEEASDWRAIDRTRIAVEVSVNGEFFADGLSANALDDPLNALVWLANACTGRGHTLKAGELITTGNTCNKAVFATKGDAAAASFAGLGTVEVTFS